MLKFIVLSTKTFGLSLIFFLMASPAYASFIGQTVDFKFSETGFPDEFKNSVTVVDPGFEVAGGDGSDIGTFIMFSGESIDIGLNTITFTIQGDGPNHATNGYQTTGFGADATYTLSGFDTDFLTLFGGASISMELDNILGVNMGSELIIGSDFITLNIGTLGVGEVIGAADLGTITLRAVPVPAALPLMLSGLFFLGFASRRR